MGIPTRNDREARYLELISAGREASTLEELFQRVCEGDGLPGICKEWDVAYGRVLMWLMGDGKRYEVYLKALELSAHREVEEALRIADGAKDAEDGVEVMAAKLRVETRFRRAKHHAKEMYGEEQRVGGGFGAGGITIVIGEVRLAEAGAGTGEVIEGDGHAEV